VLSRTPFRLRSDILGPAGRVGDGNTMWWRSPYVASIGVVIIGLALSFSAWFAVLQRENREFDARAGDHFLVLQNGIDQYINDISALRAAFQAFEHGIGRREFQSFSDQLLHEQTAIFAASWIPRVTRDQRPAHELEAARDGLSGYGIKSAAADGSLSTAEEASEYFPIFYSSREIPGSSVYGIDLNDGGLRQRWLIPLSQVTPSRFFPLPDRLASGTESQRHRRPFWVVKDLSHAERHSNRQRDPSWPSPESTGQAIAAGPVSTRGFRLGSNLVTYQPAA
jgi:CHASE domain